jgi:hypothetical protein
LLLLLATLTCCSYLLLLLATLTCCSYLLLLLAALTCCSYLLLLLPMSRTDSSFFGSSAPQRHAVSCMRHLEGEGGAASCTVLLPAAVPAALVMGWSRRRSRRAARNGSTSCSTPLASKCLMRASELGAILRRWPSAEGQRRTQRQQHACPPPRAQESDAHARCPQSPQASTQSPEAEHRYCGSSLMATRHGRRHRPPTYRHTVAAFRLQSAQAISISRGHVELEPE